MRRPNPVLEYLSDPENIKAYKKSLIYANNPDMGPSLEGMENIRTETEMIDQPMPTGHFQDYSLGLLKGAAGLPESTYSVLSGLLGMGVGGWAGAGQLAATGDWEGASDTINKVAQYMTYEPYQEAAKKQVGYMSYPFEKIHESSVWWGDKVYEKTGNPTYAATVASALEILANIALPEGVRFAGKARGKRSLRKAWDQAKERVGGDDIPYTADEYFSRIDKTQKKIRDLVKKDKIDSNAMSEALQEATELNQIYRRNFNIKGDPVSTTRMVDEVRFEKGGEPVRPETLKFAREATKEYGMDFDSAVRDITGKPAESLSNREAVEVLRKIRKDVRNSRLPSKEVNPIVKAVMEGDMHPDLFVYGLDAANRLPEPLTELPRHLTMEEGGAAAAAKARPRPAEGGIGPRPVEPPAEPPGGGGGAKAGAGAVELIEKKTGGGYKTRKALRARIKKEGKNPDDFDLVKRDDGWVGEKKAIKEEAPVKETPTKEFTELVKESADETPGWTEGADEVFISDAYNTARSKGFDGSLEDFKAKLIEAHRADELTLKGADLVEAMPREKVQNSLATYMNGEFHLIKRPKTKVTEPKKSAPGKIEEASAGEIFEGNLRYEGEGMGLHQWTDLENGGTFATKTKNAKEVLDAKAKQSASGLKPIKKDGEYITFDEDALGVLKESLVEVTDRGMTKEADRIKSQILDMYKTELRAAEKAGEVVSQSRMRELISDLKREGKPDNRTLRQKIDDILANLDEDRKSVIDRIEDEIEGVWLRGTTTHELTPRTGTGIYFGKEPHQAANYPINWRELEGYTNIGAYKLHMKNPKITHKLISVIDESQKRRLESQGYDGIVRVDPYGVIEEAAIFDKKLAERVDPPKWLKDEIGTMHQFGDTKILLREVEKAKDQNRLQAKAVEKSGGKAKVFEKPKQQGATKVDPAKVGEKHGVKYVESWEMDYPETTITREGVSIKVPAETVKEHYWYDPQTGITFHTNSLRTVKETLNEVRQMAEQRAEPPMNVGELDVMLKDVVARSKSYEEVLNSVDSAHKSVEYAYGKGLYETRSDYLSMLERLDDFRNEVRQAMRREGIDTRIADAERRGIEAGEEYVDALESAADARDVRSIAKDVWDLVKTDERGFMSIAGAEKPLNVEQAYLLKRLKNDARRAGRDLYEYLKTLGFDNKTALALQRAAEQLDESKYKSFKKDVGKTGFVERKPILETTDGTPVVKQVRKKIKGIQIDNVPVSSGEFKALFYGKDLRRTLTDRSLEPMIYVMESIDRMLPDGSVKFKDMLWHPYNAAEKAYTLAWDKLKTEIQTKKKNFNLRSRRRIGTYAVAQQKKGMAILEKQGIKEVPNLNPAEMEMYNWFRDSFDKFYKDLNNVRTKVGKRPLKRVDNYFTFFSTMNLLDKLGHKPNLILDPVSTIEARFKSMKATPFRFEKLRKNLGLPTIELDAFTIYENYAQKGLRHIHVSPIVAKVRQLQTPFQMPYKTKKGEIAYKTFNLQQKKPELARVLNSWGNHIAGLPTRPLPTGLERGMRMLNQNMTFAVLGANLRSAAIQPSALVNTFTEIGPTYLSQGLKDAFVPEMRKFAFEKSNVLVPRVYDAMINDALGAIKSGRLGEAKKWVGQKALWPLKILDANTALATWSGAYKKSIALGSSEKAAIRYADDVVVRTQASGMAGHISPIQRSSLGKFVSMFQTFVINDWNFLMKDVMNVKDGKVSRPNVRKLMSLVSATALMGMFFEDVLQVSSPFPTPLRAYGEARSNGEDQATAAFQGLMEIGERVPIVGGSARYGSHPLGAGVELLGQTTGLFGDEPFKKSYYEVTGKWLGQPGVAQIMKSYRASKRGESWYGSVMGSYTKKGQAKKKNQGMGGLGSIGSLGSL